MIGFTSEKMDWFHTGEDAINLGSTSLLMDNINNYGKMGKI